MSQANEHLMAVDSEAIREPAPPDLPVKTTPVIHASGQSYNPFRLLVSKDGPWETLSQYLAKGGEIGGITFWVIGLLISVYLLVIAPERTWVDWLLRPIIFPVFLGMLGYLIGVLVGLFAWIGFQIFHVHE